MQFVNDYLMYRLIFDNPRPPGGGVAASRSAGARTPLKERLRKNTRRSSLDSREQSSSSGALVPLPVERPQRSDSSARLKLPTDYRSRCNSNVSAKSKESAVSDSDSHHSPSQSPKGRDERQRRSLDDSPTPSPNGLLNQTRKFSTSQLHLNVAEKTSQNQQSLERTLSSPRRSISSYISADSCLQPPSSCSLMTGLNTRRTTWDLGVSEERDDEEEGSGQRQTSSSPRTPLSPNTPENELTISMPIPKYWRRMSRRRMSNFLVSSPNLSVIADNESIGSNQMDRYSGRHRSRTPTIDSTIKKNSSEIDAESLRQMEGWERSLSPESRAISTSIDSLILEPGVEKRNLELLEEAVSREEMWGNMGRWAYHQRGRNGENRVFEPRNSSEQLGVSAFQLYRELVGDHGSGGRERKTEIVHMDSIEVTTDVLLGLSHAPQNRTFSILIKEIRNLSLETSLRMTITMVGIVNGGIGVIGKKTTEVSHLVLLPKGRKKRDFEVNESFIFRYANFSVSRIHFIVEVSKPEPLNDLIGRVVVGPETEGSGVFHWRQVLLRPNFPALLWHQLRPELI